jgi:hypothetical protein
LILDGSLLDDWPGLLHRSTGKNQLRDNSQAKNMIHYLSHTELILFRCRYESIPYCAEWPR